MSKTLPTLFITGATGFLGAWVIDQAVEAGYRVKASVRERKASLIRELYGDKVEVVIVNDIATSNFVDALRGVDAIIHVAAVLPGREDSESVVSGAIDGTLNILKQAVEAGVKRFVATSTFLTVLDINRMEEAWTGHVYTDKEWCPESKGALEDLGKLQPYAVYVFAKTIAEQELWKFADEHPEIDVTTINPSYIYGPFAKAYTVPKGVYRAMGSDGYFFQHVFAGSNVKSPAEQKDLPALSVDVRDLAQAHIQAVHAPLSNEPGVGRKRILMCGPNYTFADAAKHLRKARPELTARITDPSDAIPQTISTLDNTRLFEIVKFREFTPWEQTVEDTADSIIALEKTWEAQPETA